MNILIMSDIHGNIEALKSVNEYLKNQKIDKLMLLGDIIDYGPHSNEVIEFISNLPYEIICNIRGNHEEWSNMFIVDYMTLIFMVKHMQNLMANTQR